MDPEKFNSEEDFLAKYGDLKDSSQVAELHSELKPYLLRRMKEHVEKSIIAKGTLNVLHMYSFLTEETIIEVELTTIQKKYYRAIYEKNYDFLSKGTKGANMPNLINIMMELRKCCNHAYLIKGAEEQLTADLTTQEELYKTLIQSSGRIALI